MKIGIYNRWLTTFGGGEKHSLTIAERLSHQNPVDVISHKPVLKTELSRRLHLDLSKVNFRFIPEYSLEQLSAITAQYDLFITASYLDYFPSRAGKSISLIFFPSPFETEKKIKFKTWAKLILRQWFCLPWFVQGLQKIETEKDSFRFFLTLPARIRFPSLNSAYLLDFDIHSKEGDLAGVQIFRNNESIRIFSEENDTKTNYKITINIPQKENGIQTIQIFRPDTGDNQSKNTIMLNALKVRNARHRVYRTLFERLFTPWGLKLYNFSSSSYSINNVINSYDAIWANSEYTQKWIARYWNIESDVFPPPIDIDQFYCRPKKNIVLSVGRFFTGGHNKKHDVMINSFRKLVDNGLEGWELHLIGGSTPGKSHVDYLRKLSEMAKGYPIFIHTDVDYQALLDWYAESSIYWHASGYGEDEEKDPVKFEHFGITTVEAMASGCVPVVIGKGGQVEIIQHEQDGFLWQNLDELIGYTLKLINDRQLFQQMSHNAQMSCRRYGREEFNRRLDELLSTVF